MPRESTGTWIPARQVYVASLGERYTYVRPDGQAISRRRQVILTDPDGTPIRHGDDAGRRAAIARLKAACAAEDEAAGLGAGPPTTARLLGLWAEWHRRHARPNTGRAYAYVARRASNVPFRGGLIGDVPADEFGVEHLFAIRARLRAEGVDDGGIQPLDAHVRAAFRWASKAVEGREPIVLLNRNPFPPGSVKGLAPPRSDRPCPTWEELTTILDRLDEHVAREMAGGYTSKSRARALANALAVRVIGERGARPKEVCDLMVSDWDEETGGFAFGARHKTGHRGVAGVLPLRPATADRVRAYLATEGRRGPYVLWPERREGQGAPRPGQLAAWWRDVKDKVGGERYTLYSFRNTISNHLRRAGVGGRSIQLALRQTDTVADTVYRRDLIDEAARVFREAGLD